jgi:hypothetical protein
MIITRQCSIKSKLSKWLTPRMLHLHASGLISKVVCTATGTLVRRRELRRLLSGNLTVNVVAHAWRGVAVNVIGSYFGPFPERISRKVHSERMSAPAAPERWRSVAPHG